MIELYEDIKDNTPGLFGKAIHMITIGKKPKRNDMIRPNKSKYTLYIVDAEKAEGIYEQPTFHIQCIIVTNDPMNAYLEEKFTKAGTKYKILNI